MEANPPSEPSEHVEGEVVQDAPSEQHAVDLVGNEHVPDVPPEPSPEASSAAPAEAYAAPAEAYAAPAEAYAAPAEAGTAPVEAGTAPVDAYATPAEASSAAQPPALRLPAFQLPAFDENANVPAFAQGGQLPPLSSLGGSISMAFPEAHAQHAQFGWGATNKPSRPPEAAQQPASSAAAPSGPPPEESGPTNEHDEPRRPRERTRKRSQGARQMRRDGESDGEGRHQRREHIENDDGNDGFTLWQQLESLPPGSQPTFVLLHRVGASSAAPFVEVPYEPSPDSPGVGGVPSGPGIRYTLLTTRQYKLRLNDMRPEWLSAWSGVTLRVSLAYKDDGSSVLHAVRPDKPAKYGRMRRLREMQMAAMREAYEAGQPCSMEDIEGSADWMPPAADPGPLLEFEASSAASSAAFRNARQCRKVIFTLGPNGQSDGTFGIVASTFRHERRPFVLRVELGGHPGDAPRAAFAGRIEIVTRAHKGGQGGGGGGAAADRAALAVLGNSPVSGGGGGGGGGGANDSPRRGPVEGAAAEAGGANGGARAGAGASAGPREVIAELCPQCGAEIPCDCGVLALSGLKNGRRGAAAAAEQRGGRNGGGQLRWGVPGEAGGRDSASQGGGGAAGAGGGAPRGRRSRKGGASSGSDDDEPPRQYRGPYRGPVPVAYPVRSYGYGHHGYEGGRWYGPGPGYGHSAPVYAPNAEIPYGGHLPLPYPPHMHPYRHAGPHDAPYGMPAHGFAYPYVGPSGEPMYGPGGHFPPSERGPGPYFGYGYAHGPPPYPDERRGGYAGPGGPYGEERRGGPLALTYDGPAPGEHRYPPAYWRAAPVDPAAGPGGAYPPGSAAAAAVAAAASARHAPDGSPHGQCEPRGCAPGGKCVQCGKHVKQPKHLYEHVRECRRKSLATPRSDPSSAIAMSSNMPLSCEMKDVALSSSSSSCASSSSQPQDHGLSSSVTSSVSPSSQPDDRGLSSSVASSVSPSSLPDDRGLSSSFASSVSPSSQPDDHSQSSPAAIASSTSLSNSSQQRTEGEHASCHSF
eukprot:tig00020710_g13275.t1